MSQDAGVKIGYPLFGLGPRSWAAVCEKADETGFDSIWMQEHLIFPTEIPPTYPYSDNGVPPINPDTQLYDVWVSLAYIAARTSKIRLATNVFIIPLRDPIVTARAVTTLDRLSGGRLIIGGGVGWLKEEFEIAGQEWRTRGKRTDEIIEIWRKLWSEETIEHHGDHYDFQARAVLAEVGPEARHPHPHRRRDRAGDAPGGAARRRLDRRRRARPQEHQAPRRPAQ